MSNKPNYLKTAFLSHLLLLVALLIHGAVSADAGVAFMLRDGMVIRDGLLPVYSAEAETPCAFIRVGLLHQDFQTRGFFRIGVMPCVRAEKVEIIISDPERLAEVLVGVRPLILGRGSRGSFEMHDVTFRIEEETSPRLVAPRIRLTETGDWDLLDGCQVWADGGLRALPRSRLMATGPNAGELHTLMDGRSVVFHPLNANSLSEER